MPVSDLEQAVDRQQLRLTPEARVHRRRRIAVDEGVRVHVPHDAAVRGLDPHRVDRPDEASARVLEVLGVGEGQRVQCRFVGLLRSVAQPSA